MVASKVSYVTKQNFSSKFRSKGLLVRHSQNLLLAPTPQMTESVSPARVCFSLPVQMLEPTTFASNSCSFATSVVNALEFNPMLAANTREILFVDSSVENYETLLQGVKPGVKAIVLDPRRDGVVQITEVLRDYFAVENIHIVSHGSPGCLYLGNARLGLHSLETYAWALTAWFDRSRARGLQPSLLLYGCNVASGDAGEEFVAKLRQLTGAEIAASTTPIGHAERGGDWTLDRVTGEIAAEAMVVPHWDGLLGVVVQNNTGNTASEIKSDQEWAQTFTVPSNTEISRIRLRLRKDADAVPQQISVYLETSLGNEDYGPVSRNLGALNADNTFGFVGFNFPGVTLTAEQTYYIRVVTNTTAGKVYLGTAASGDPFSGGALFKDEAEQTDQDAAFRVISPDPAEIDLDASNPANLDFAVSFLQNGDPINVTYTVVTVTDPDDTTLQSLTFTVNGVLDDSSEFLFIGDGEFDLSQDDTQVVTVGSTDFDVDYDSGTGIFTVTLDGGGEMDLAEAQAAIADVRYQNLATVPTFGDRTITFSANDGDLDSNPPAVSTITVQLDSDGDGVVDSVDLDDDNDGILDAVEVTPANSVLAGQSMQDLFVPKGSANFISANELQLTPAANNESGIANSNVTVDLSQDFQIAFEVFLGNQDSGADGLAFVMHNDPAGTFASAGVGGPGVGAWSIQNGLAFEFDTYQNGNVGDPVQDHFSVWDTDTGTPEFAGAPSDPMTVVLPAVALPNLEDGQWRRFSASWDAASQEMTFFFNGSAIGTLSEDLVTNYFGGSNQVYLAFTGATGGANNDQRVRWIDTSDTDGDGVINSLDLDSDNDGISDLTEALPNGTDISAIDSNFDGRYDLAGATTGGIDNNFNPTGVANAANSGAGNSPVNTDASSSVLPDAIPDYLDLDSDSDLIPDSIEAQSSATYVPPSTLTNFEGVNASGLFQPINTDGDGAADYRDNDSDNDLLDDNTEVINPGFSPSGVDANSDGIDDGAGASYADPNGIVDDPFGGQLSDSSGGVEVDFRAPSDLTLDLNGAPQRCRLCQYLQGQQSCGCSCRCRLRHCWCRVRRYPNHYRRRHPRRR